MERINSPTQHFVNGDPFDGIQGTVVTADWLNSVQEEIAAVIESAGITLDPTQTNQMYTAILQIIGSMLTTAITQLSLGSLSKLNTGGAFLKTDSSNRLAVANGAMLGADANGNLTINLGQGFRNDGAGNLTLKLADNSLRLTAAGIQANEPITYLSANSSVIASSHFANFVSSAALTLSLAQTSTQWNGFCFSVNAQGGAITVTPNAAESINGMTAGKSYTVLQGSTALFITDGAGNWQVFYQTSPPGSMYPRYINTAATIGAGMYEADTSAGSFQLTLTTSPTNGDTVRLIDWAGTWAQNPVAISPNGNKICGSTTSFLCNVTGEDFILRYVAASNDWRLQ